MALSGEKASAFGGFTIADMLPKAEETVVKPEKKEEKVVKKPVNKEKKKEPAAAEPKRVGESPKTKKEPEQASEPVHNILNIPNKKGHGVAKSVYFDDDNFAYIEQVSKDNDVKFSVVLNLVIKQFREEHK